METTLKIVDYLLLVALLILPIIILVKTSKFRVRYPIIPYLIISLLVWGLLMALMAWWSYYSKEMLLENLGYDFHALTEAESFKNVSESNKAKAEQLYLSIMGIGWPLKAIMGFFITGPYVLLVYLCKYLMNRKTVNNTVTQ
ncbi:hypothetical protein EMN47_16010 [Prolixibacteraceae bacterium JC049]|nr:hypothetical protein [Prolixibacteraceae bacterium JC049]